MTYPGWTSTGGGKTSGQEQTVPMSGLIYFTAQSDRLQTPGSEKKTADRRINAQKRVTTEDAANMRELKKNQSYFI